MINLLLGVAAAVMLAGAVMVLVAIVWTVPLLLEWRREDRAHRNRLHNRMGRRPLRRKRGRGVWREHYWGKKGPFPWIKRKVRS